MGFTWKRSSPVFDRTMRRKVKRHCIAAVIATPALELVQGASPCHRCPGFAPAASGPSRHSTSNTSGTPRARANLRLAASGKMVYARMRIGVRCRGRPRRRAQTHLACAHRTPLVCSMCALKWALQGFIDRFSLGADGGWPPEGLARIWRVLSAQATLQRFFSPPAICFYVY